MYSFTSVLKNSKPVLLAVVFVFVAGSYFTSDTFKRGESTLRGLSPSGVAKVICPDNPKDKPECQDRVDQALVTVNLACVAPTRDVWVCGGGGAKSGAKKDGQDCPQERERLQTCLQAHLEPQLRRFSFTAEEIALLDVGSGSEKNEYEKGPEEGEGGKEGRGNVSDKEVKENVDAKDEGPGNPQVKVEEAHEGGADGVVR